MNVTDFETKHDKIEVSPQGMIRGDVTGKGAFDLLPFLALIRVAKLYGRGALQKGARNWEKGMYLCLHFQKAMRHGIQWMLRMKDEDHAAAVVFHWLAIMHHEELGRTDLDDRPVYEKYLPSTPAIDPTTMALERRLEENEEISSIS